MEAVDAAILIDEVGIETGCYGEFRLKTLGRPVFRERRGMLELAAVRTELQARFFGRPVADATFRAEVRPDDRLFVERVALAVHLRNHRNLDAGDARLQLDWIGEAAGGARDVAGLAACEDIDLDPAGLDWRINGHADPKLLGRTAEAIRGIGGRLLLCGFGDSAFRLDALDATAPEMVAVDGGWFRRVAAEPASMRLFGSLLALLKDAGVTVLVEDIQTPRQFELALDSGVDLFAGDLLGRPALAGVGFDLSPRPVDAIRERGVVVPLFRTHHRR